MPAASILALSLLSAPFVSCSSTQMAIPFEAEARRNNEAVLAYQEGKRLEGEGKYELAISSYTEALPYPKIHDAALYKIGRLSSLSGDWERAEGAFMELLLDDPDNTAARQSLAYVWCQSGREEEGLAAYRALHEEKPHDEQIFQGYIKALKMNGLDDEAESEEAAFEDLFPHRISK
ncbi:MAG: hypothetical protein K6G18_17135 [Treponema sp.]|nr:hypothetical protein [Treponema sp.]MCR5623565.1 hypothetical protein [Treponema sp.]